MDLSLSLGLVNAKSDDCRIWKVTKQRKQQVFETHIRDRGITERETHNNYKFRARAIRKSDHEECSSLCMCVEEVLYKYNLLCYCMEPNTSLIPFIGCEDKSARWSTLYLEYSSFPNETDSNRNTLLLY